MVDKLNEALRKKEALNNEPNEDDDVDLSEKPAKSNKKVVEPIQKDEMDEYVDPEASFGLYKSCNCLPSCTSIHYDTEVSQSAVDLVEYYKANNFYDKEKDR